MFTSSKIAAGLRLLAILGTAATIAACDRAITEPTSSQRTASKAHRDLEDTLACRGGWVIVVGIVYCQ